MKRYLLNLLISLDCLANALTCGSPYETISARCARGHYRAAELINRLFMDAEHCSRAMRFVGSPILSIPSRKRWQVYALWAAALAFTLVARR